MSDQRDVGYGLRSRPDRHRPQDPRAHVDIFSRFSPAVDPRFSICKTVGYPKTIAVPTRARNSFPAISISGLIIVLDFSRPGKPTDNSFIKSFNGKFQKRMLEHPLVPEP